MPIVILLLIAIMFGMFGFWDTIGAILGGIAVIVVLIFLLALTLALTGWWLMRRGGGRIIIHKPDDRP